MRTNTQVEFGLFDVTARDDSTPGCQAAWAWNDVAKDLRQEKRPQMQKYGTLEHRQFLMDGSFGLFPDEPQQQYWGLWSRQQSDENGGFDVPPVLEVSFSQPHSSAGITLHFYEPTQDWASKVLIQWFGSANEPLASARFEPSGTGFFCRRTVSAYTKLRITFYATNRPGRYLKLAGIDYGVALNFAGQEVVTARILEEIDPLSNQISINTLNLTIYNRQGSFSILNPEGVFDVLQDKQRFTVYEDVRPTARSEDVIRHNMGTFYLSHWSNTSDTLADFVATDAIGLLDSDFYNGGVYDTTAGRLVADVLHGYRYQLDDALAAERLQGHLPIGSRRSALQQIAFALGAVVDCSRSDRIKIYLPPERPSCIITRQRKLMGGKANVRALVTGVSITAHRYQLSGTTEELYKDVLPEGDHRITLTDPAAHIAAEGAELLEAGNNYVVIRVPKERQVILTGSKYSDAKTVVMKKAPNLPPNTQENILKVDQATLISPERAAAAAQRILDYYTLRYELPFRVVAGSEQLADVVILESFGGARARGVLERMEFDLTGGYLADVVMVGSRMDAIAEAYIGEIHTGERSLI